MNEYFCTSPAHAPITFLTVRGRVLSQTLTIRRLCCHFSHSYIKTFSECWSTLIVMIYDIFASQKHIFAIYARTKEHFMSLLRAFFGNPFLLKMKKKIGLIAQYALDIYMVTSKYSQKLHEKCIDLSCSYGEKTILGKDNRKYVLNTIFKQVCEMLSLAIRS